MFAKLEAWFNTFFLGYAGRVSGDLATGLVPVALALITIYIGVYGLAVMRGEASEPVGIFAWKMVKVGAILSFALPGLYYSGNVVAWATGLQDGLATLFVAPRAAAATTAFGALDLANTAANEQLALLWKDASMFRLDLVLASNVFEHLERNDLLVTLAQIRRKLKPQGSLVALQPNYRFAYREYFDDYTHVAVFSDRSLGDLLEAEGFRVVERRPRFLPLAVESRLPVHSALIRLYLSSPWKPLGKQMLLRAVPGPGGAN